MSPSPGPVGASLSLSPTVTVGGIFGHHLPNFEVHPLIPQKKSDAHHRLEVPSNSVDPFWTFLSPRCVDVPSHPVRGTVSPLRMPLTFQAEILSNGFAGEPMATGGTCDVHQVWGWENSQRGMGWGQDSGFIRFGMGGGLSMFLSRCHLARCRPFFCDCCSEHRA